MQGILSSRGMPYRGGWNGSVFVCGEMLCFGKLFRGQFWTQVIFAFDLRFRNKVQSLFMIFHLHFKLVGKNIIKYNQRFATAKGRMSARSGHLPASSQMSDVAEVTTFCSSRTWC